MFVFPFSWYLPNAVNRLSTTTVTSQTLQESGRFKEKNYKAVKFLLTPRQHFNMHRVREGSVSHRGKSQHTDGIGLRWSQALDGGDHTILNVMDLPVAHWLRRVHGVVNSIALYLAVGFFRILPPDSYCAG